MAEITKIAITGGPCSGRSSAMSLVQRFFTGRGYTVMLVPEAGRVSGGADMLARQMALEMEKERLLEETAGAMRAERVLIVCGRGLMDYRACMSGAEFRGVLEKTGWNEVQLRDGYDGVFHLETAAKGPAGAYCGGDVPPERAIEIDDGLISAWTGNPHFRVIGFYEDLRDKLRRLTDEIRALLGDPEPLEIERKFLIGYPDTAALERDPFCRRAEIVQTYLIPREGQEEARVRQRGSDGHYIYTYTTKRRLSAVRRVEVERRLTRDEYLELLREADPDRRPLRKDRYCLVYAGQYFELDVYPFWDDRATMEIELLDEAQAIELPEWVRVIREVTGEREYRNSELAKMV